MQLGPSESINTPPNEPTTLAHPASGDAGTQLQQNNPTAIEGLISRLNSPNTLFVFGIFLIVFLMMRMLRKNHKTNAKRSNKLASPSKRIANIHAQAQASMSPNEQLMVKTEEITRRLGATLDNKAARLELLIEEADRKLAQLNRQLANPTPNESEINAPSLPPQHSAHSQRTIDPTLLDRARLEQDIEERQTRVAGRIDPITQPHATEPKPQAPTQAPPSIQSQVVELAAAGLSNIEIAHQLNEPIGQVELILNLRKQQG
ncbi:MAG: hypothetical protein JKX70_09995 [Phycisphaerales bacterium]|nr:hypothetical protein [Phycisphaerales bacterium]